jgi:hypothetical protein
MGVFHLQPRAGWHFVRLEALELSGGHGLLYDQWAATFLDRGLSLPVNSFSPNLQKVLGIQRLPTHSRFYHDLKIAGFVDDERSFVFVHHLGGEVMLQRASKSR